MKHIIVIETADHDDGTPRPVREWTQEFVEEIVDQTIMTEHGICVVRSKFNVSSAIAAVHEMYGAPSWNPNDIPSR